MDQRNQARWTDDQYLTKDELKKSLGISSIDPIWNKILDYRRANARALNLKSSSKITFTFCDSPALAKKYSDFEAKLGEYTNELSHLTDSPKVLNRFQQEAAYQVLQWVNEAEKAKVSELSIRAMLNGTYCEHDETHIPLLGYRDNLADMRHHRLSGLCEDLLALIYQRETGEEELTSFYRQSDPVNRWSTIQVNSDYLWAHYDDIPDKMEEMFSFAEDPDPSCFLRAAGVLFDVLYIKPFDAHNECIAALCAKYVLMQEYGSAAALIPVEGLITPSQLRLSSAMKNTQRENDLTYFIFYVIDTLSPLLDRFARIIATVTADVMDEERAPLSPSDLEGYVPKERKPRTPTNPASRPFSYSQPNASVTENVEQSNYSVSEETVSSDDREEKELEAPSPVQKPAEEAEEESRDSTTISLKEEKPEPAPVVHIEPRVTVPTINSLEEMPQGRAERAISLPEKKLSEREVKEYARYIVETNPNIRRQQASFYANHSTLGRYYTIQDYKRTMKVAYETARTSMDNLAANGFYQKVKFKNKFVYTPIKQGE